MAEAFRSHSLTYFRAIGIDRNVLDFTLALDMREFEDFLSIPRFPLFAAARVHACAYLRIDFPEVTSERVAIGILKEYVKEHPVECVIHYPDVKTIVVTKRGEVRDCPHLPIIEFTKTHAVPLSAGGPFGRVRG